eukprot:TRINITY_DN7979_c0_g1_i1.p1 TRINITY_DN7979_c0_g1~~TRINITY_DN7979_c0_g1_i1.p1  ORF type:complete len:269 (-),score=15.17 TRINITY_DN7979_c0_g1_i1:15-821(-)
MVFIISFAKIALFLRFQRKIHVGLIILLLVCIGNLIRALVNVTDPIGTRRIIPNPWQFIFLTLHLPFSTIATLAITLFWLELVTREGKVAVSNFLHRLLWPFVVAGFLLVALELSTSISRGLFYVSQPLLAISGALYAVIEGGLTVLFAVTGRSILRQLDRGASIASDNVVSRRLRRATIMILVSTIGNIGFIISAILIGTSIYSQQVGGSATAFVGLFSITFSDICKVIAIRAPTAKQMQKHVGTNALGDAKLPKGDKDQTSITHRN